MKTRSASRSPGSAPRNGSSPKVFPMLPASNPESSQTMTRSSNTPTTISAPATAGRRRTGSSATQPAQSVPAGSQSPIRSASVPFPNGLTASISSAPGPTRIPTPSSHCLPKRWNTRRRGPIRILSTTRPSGTMPEPLPPAAKTVFRANTPSAWAPTATANARGSIFPAARARSAVTSAVRSNSFSKAAIR